MILKINNIYKVFNSYYYMLKTVQEQRRDYVNEEFAKQVEGTHMSNSDKAKLMSKLWKEAKKKFK